MSEHFDVFISSTSKDLEEFRLEVRNVIIRLGMFPIDMVDFEPSNSNALQMCYDKMQEAEIFIGIYAHRYGYTPSSEITYKTKDGEIRTGDGKTGITHWEYLWAQEKGIPCLYFVIKEDAPWNPKLIDKGKLAKAMQAFKNTITTNHGVKFFGDKNELTKEVALSLQQTKPEFVAKAVSSWRALRAPEPPYYFAGRSKETSEILAGLAKSKTLLMTGIGGTGKTTLARHIGKEAQATYGGGILWLQLNPDIKQEKDAQLRAIAAWKEAHPASRDSNAEISPNDLKRLLSERPAPLLAILDDAWSTDVIMGIRACLPDGTPLLVTSRSASIATSKIGDYELYPLEHLSSDDAVIMLRSYFELDETHKPILKEIADLLGNHALALQLAAAWVKRDSPRNVVQEIPQLKAKLQAPKGLFRTLKMGDSRDENLEKALELSYEPLEEKLKSAFRLLSALPRGLDFTPELAFAVWDIAEDEEARSDADENLRQLMRIGLLERRSNGRYFLHQSLHAYASKLIEDEGEKAAQEEAIERYYTKLTELARGFFDLPMQAWLSKLEEPYLQHFFQRADELLKVDIETDAEEGVQKVSNFFTNTKNLVAQRPQYHLLAWLEKGLAASQKLEQRSREALFLNELGYYYSSRGQSGKALDYYERGLILQRELNNRREEGTLLSNIGSIYNARGEVYKALKHFQQALSIQSEVGDRSGEGATLSNIAGIYVALRELYVALKFNQQALAIHQEVRNRIREGTTLNNMGEIYRQHGEVDKALEHFQQALAIHQEVRNRAMEGITLNNMGLIYFAQGELEKTLETWILVLGILREVGDRRNEATSLSNLAVIYEKMGNLDKAIDYLEAALPIFEAVQSPNFQANKDYLEGLKQKRDGR